MKQAILGSMILLGILGGMVKAFTRYPEAAVFAVYCAAWLGVIVVAALLIWRLARLWGGEEW